MKPYSKDLRIRVLDNLGALKNVLRKVGARTHEALVETIAWALSEVTPRTQPDGSIIAATRSRFDTYE